MAACNSVLEVFVNAAVLFLLPLDSLCALAFSGWLYQYTGEALLCQGPYCLRVSILLRNYEIQGAGLAETWSVRHQG